MFNLTKCILFITVSALFISTSGSAFAQNGYPTFEEKYVNDYADIISEADENRIRSQFKSVDDRTGIEATVLTIGSIQDYDTGDETIESFATTLFNTWGIGSAVENEGILILVALNDRQIRIELADGFKGEHDAAMKRIIDNTILPQFREGNFSQGVRDGSLEAIERIAGQQLQALESDDQTAVLLTQPDTVQTFTQNRSESNSSSARNNSEYSTGPASSPSSSPIWPAIGLVSLVAALGVGGGAAAVQFIGRRDKPRPCPNCDEMMEKLDEVGDDLYLDSGQQTEEFLNSVDYDVWKCPNCQAHSVYPYTRWFSGYSNCPRCSYQALKKTSNVTDRPTTRSTGRKEIRSECRHCDYDRTETVILPRVEERSSSSTSSSFGSGSSSRRSSGSSSRRSSSSSSRRSNGSSSRRSSSSSSRRSSSSSFSGGSSSGGGASGSW